MTDAVLGAAALDAEIAAEIVTESEERRRDAEIAARDEAIRTPYALYWALCQALGDSDADTAPVSADRLWQVQMQPFEPDVTVPELAACLLWCSRHYVAAVRVALCDRILAANADDIRIRVTELEGA